MLAIKAARAFTGKHKIAKFEGAYHGIYDYVQVSEGATPDHWGEASAPRGIAEAGAPPSVAEDVIVMPWNNFAACERLIAAHKNRLAALVFDPLPLGIGLIAPQAGFIEFLREVTDQHGILLIADEVLTFRLSYRGATEEYGVSPDLVTLGKIIGGGFPVGAVAGSCEVMSVFDHTSNLQLHHGGTYNANPVTMTAGLETMRMMSPEAYERLDQMGEYMRRRLAEMLGERGIPAKINGKGSLFLALLTERELTDYRSLIGSYSRTNPLSGPLCHEMLRRGIVTSPRGVFGCLSTPMSESELDAFVDALDQSLDQSLKQR
jgi:glutamate-1-semialdehyde 2,1-aminomutase